MSTKSKIQWCDSTWNPVIGCSKVSAGCANCYAEQMACRLAMMGKANYQQVVQGQIEENPKHWNGQVALVESALTQLLRWKQPRKIFVCSMGDLFHEQVPFAFIDQVFAVMALCPQHTFIVLTKRPERMAKYFNEEVVNRGFGADSLRGNIHSLMGEMCALGKDGKRLSLFVRKRSGGLKAHDESDFLVPKRGSEHLTVGSAGLAWPLPNVSLGTSVENRSVLDRLDWLSKCPSVVHAISFEPLLEDLGDISPYLAKLTNPWAIVGGESGPRARPCNVEWIRSIVGQCKAAGVPVFVKQLGANPVKFGPCDCGRVGHGLCHSECPNLKLYPIKLCDRKGDHPWQWPKDLRVRQWPEAPR